MKIIYTSNNKKINKDTYQPQKKNNKIPSNKIINDPKNINNIIMKNINNINIINDINNDDYQNENEKNLNKIQLNKIPSNKNIIKNIVIDRQIIKYSNKIKILFHIDILLLFEKDNLTWIINYINFLKIIQKT